MAGGAMTQLGGGAMTQLGIGPMALLAGWLGEVR